MHNTALLFIQDLAIIMLIAGVTTLICRRLKQPIVLGYIFAGIIIGPHTPPFSFIADEDIIKTLAELGVIFLMFSLGLEFNLHKLTKVGKTSVIAAVLEIVLMLWVGYELGLLFGWSRLNAIFLGALLSISSTTIIVKALDELKMKKQEFAQVIFGILIVEDIFAIIILALLSSIAITGVLHFKEILITATKLSAFLAVALMLGILFVPKLLSYVASFKSDEVILIVVLGLCFGFCLLVLRMDYSVALGAFIIGAIIAESDQLLKIEHLIGPLKDMFSAIFFVTVGLMFDPHVLVNYLVPVLLITAVVVVGKILSCSFGVLVSGRDAKTSMRVGMGLAQIGEFSFIIASLGVALKVTGDFIYSMAVCVSIITTLLTPYLIKYSDSFTRRIAHYIPSSIANTFKLYIEWMNAIQMDESQARLRKAINHALAHILVNFLIVIAVFLVGIYFANTGFGSILVTTLSVYMQKSIIWATCLIVSLPFIVAVYRKIRALSMILAEARVVEEERNHFTVKIRRLVSQLIPILSILVMMFIISALSATILPPIELLALVLILSVFILIFLLPWFVKIHARLQAAILDTIKKE